MLKQRLSAAGRYERINERPKAYALNNPGRLYRHSFDHSLADRRHWLALAVVCPAICSASAEILLDESSNVTSLSAHQANGEIKDRVIGP
ncbi:MAG TPA: hypothetical protein VN956_03125 [Pyrinomonadaceae bacterium]|nr:hypothetical protein [Pyrinomonadaceae bacterium]